MLAVLLRVSQIIIKDGYHFNTKINQVYMKPSYIMASFDIVIIHKYNFTGNY